jgi:hypothetical protein
VRKDGTVGSEEWQEKVCYRQEWKKLLRMARNCRVLHVSGMNDLSSSISHFITDNKHPMPRMQYHSRTKINKHLVMECNIPRE